MGQFWPPVSQKLRIKWDKSVGYINGFHQINDLFLQSSANRVTAYFANLRKFAHEMIEEHRLTFDPDNIRDFTDVFLLSESNKGEDGSKTVSGENIVLNHHIA